MLFSTWAWNIICAPDVFTWNFAFMLMNMAQVFHILYQLRPVKFDPELEEVYHTLFEPFKVNILLKNVFKMLFWVNRVYKNCYSTAYKVQQILDIVSSVMN